MVAMSEDLLGEDIELRIERLKTLENEAGFDPFGFDPVTARYSLAVTAFLHRWYFRTEVFGLDNLPEGRLLIVANHSGQLPIDGVIITTSLILDCDPPRFSRNLVEKWAQELPFVSMFYSRSGQVVGDPDNARRLLAGEETLVVFPEGARGIAKPFDQRYQLVDFGLGFMRLALETNTPILPVAVVGGEEQYISVGNIKPLAKLLHMPVFPIVPQLFLGMPLPLPVRYRLHFGTPMTFQGDPDDDDEVISGKVKTVRDRIQGMVDDGVRSRPSVFL